MIDDHITRVKDALANVYHLGNLSSWIAKNTRINSKKFSYLGREYQQDIIDDTSKELYCLKAAQTGLTEILTRWVTAIATTQSDMTIIYTMPTSTDAQLFAKARLDPMIAGSAELSRAMSKTVNSVELKQFNENSFIYTRGTVSESGALSVPADILIHDELDRSNLDNVAAYVSRLQAKPTKMRRLFSTPTVSKYGISALADNSKRKKQIWTCSHCSHMFLPSYHDHVVIPGFTGEKKEINKHNIKDVNWRDAQLLCPKCGKVPDSDISRREWVVENQLDNYDAVSYFVSPFCAPSFISVPYLVEVSSRYGKWSEFCNQSLGETAEDSSECLTRTDIEACNTPNSLVNSDMHVLGADMGITCHIWVGRLHNGLFLLVHRETVFYTKFQERRAALCNQYRVLISVHDMFPYTDMITQITDYDINAYGAIYVDKKSTETHYIKEQEEDVEEGKLNVRSVMINRNVAFDALMSAIKRKELVIHGLDEYVIDQLLSMKRIQKFDKHQTMSYVWEKTDGNDHYHNALLYCWVASQLMGTAGGQIDLSILGLVSSFRQKLP